MNDKQLARIFFLLFLFSLLVACGPNPADLSATVAAKVNTAVESTVAALPTATPQPTYTAEPTYTPNPTYTPPATATTLPTYTPYPTYTPNPTDTPLPTETPTPSPSPTTQATTSAANQPPPAGTTNTFTAAAVANTISLLETIMINLRPSMTASGFDLTVDCPAFLATHGQFVATLVPAVSSSDPTIQNAYTNYQSGTNIFLTAVAAWVESCQQAVANQEIRSIGNQDLDVISAQANQAHALLDEARNALQ